MAPRKPRVLSGTPAEHGYTFPAEWRPHAATWISWPRPEGISFPGFYHRSIQDVVRIIKTITAFEPVHLNVPNENYIRIVRETLRKGGVPPRRVEVARSGTPSSEKKSTFSRKLSTSSAICPRPPRPRSCASCRSTRSRRWGLRRRPRWSFGWWLLPTAISPAMSRMAVFAVISWPG